jgi:hypothetical protein
MLRKHHDAALRQKTLCDAELLRLERNTLEVKKILVALTDSLKNLKDQLSVSRKAMNHDQRKQKQVRAHSFVFFFFFSFLRERSNLRAIVTGT